MNHGVLGYTKLLFATTVISVLLLKTSCCIAGDRTFWILLLLMKDSVKVWLCIWTVQLNWLIRRFIIICTFFAFILKFKDDCRIYGRIILSVVVLILVFISQILLGQITASHYLRFIVINLWIKYRWSYCNEQLLLFFVAGDVKVWIFVIL